MLLAAGSGRATRSACKAVKVEALKFVGEAVVVESAYGGEGKDEDWCNNKYTHAGFPRTSMSLTV